MSYLSDIKKSLTEIAAKHQLTGVSVELAKDLLAQALYQSKTDSISLINKNSVDTTNNMNTIIQYALTNLYPIYRGRNAIIRVKGFFTSGNIVLHRGDKVFSSKKFNLYVIKTVAPGSNNIILGDIDGYDFSVTDEPNLNQNYVPVTIDLLVAKNFIDDTEFELKNAGFYVESNVTEEFSEDVEIKRGMSGDIQSMAYTKLASEHIDRMNQFYDPETMLIVNDMPNPLPLLLTSYNFGIRLYPGEIVPRTITTYHGVEKTISKLSPINSDIKYYYNYFPYYEYNPTFEEVKNLSITGFQIIRTDGETESIGTQTDFNQYGINLLPYIARETIDDNTAYKIKIGLVQIQKLRSIYDITDVFNKYFETKVYNSSVILSSDATGTTSTDITIYYIPKDSEQVTVDEFNEFRSNLLYYLTPWVNLQCEEAPICVVSIDVVVKSTVYVASNEVSNILNSYNYSTNCSITYQEIYARLSKIQSVVSVTMQVHRQYSNQDNSEPIVPTASGETYIVTREDLRNDYISMVFSYNNELTDEVTVSR